MDIKDRCHSLIVWLNTFQVKAPITQADQLLDGVELAEILGQIAPSYFDEAWKSKIKADGNSNWRLKASNLKKILNGMLDYYKDVLEQQIQDFEVPEVNTIAEFGDCMQLARLLQLVVGCAVHCENKQQHIENIMGLEESVQQAVMEAIQELMSKECSTTPRDQDQPTTDLRQATEQLNRALEEKDDLAQRCHELDLQIASLLEEKTNLENENHQLAQRLSQADSMDDPSVFDDGTQFLLSTPLGRRYQQLQSQVDTLQEELFKAEAVKDDLRIRVELQGKELLEQQQKNEELLALAGTAQTYKDEVDILKHTTLKVSKYESQIETFKKKLEEMGEMKSQLKLLEDKNTTYMKTNMELEEEVRRLGSFKSQLEMYKRQVHELQSLCSEETKRADKAEFDAKRSEAKMESLLREKTHLQEENTRLNETVDDLKGFHAQKENLYCLELCSIMSPVSQCSDNFAGGDSASYPYGSADLGLMSLPTEVKEKLLRLERDNKQLREAAGSNEDTAVIQSMLDDANQRRIKLEQENRELNQRLMEATAQLEDLTDQRSAGTDASSELKHHLTEQLGHVRQLESRLQVTTGQLEEAESRHAASEARIKEMEGTLERRQRDMAEMEGRYKQYLLKAKAALETADPKRYTGSGPELLALRNQLTEKDQLLKTLEKDHENNKAVKEQEEKLMITAWYNLSTQLHRQATEERLRTTGAGQSFLARQRQARTSTVNSGPHINNTAAR